MTMRYLGLDVHAEPSPPRSPNRMGKFPAGTVDRIRTTHTGTRDPLTHALCIGYTRHARRGRGGVSQECYKCAGSPRRVPVRPREHCPLMAITPSVSRRYRAGGLPFAFGHRSARPSQGPFEGGGESYPGRPDA